MLPSAVRHGVGREDIEHATRNAIVIEDLDDDLRLYLGAGQNGAMLEVIALLDEHDEELVIHAMPMRPKYQRLLPGGDR